MKNAVVVVGTQWGDEGKGKITNYLSQKADVVVRYQGGDNAGHTIKFLGKTYALHVRCNNLYISNRAHIIFDYHQALDGLIEEHLGVNKIGTTKKGIGPCYTDKIARQGIRVADFVSKDFEKIYRATLQIKNEQIKSYGGQMFDIDKSYQEYQIIADAIRPYVVDTVQLLNDEIKNNKKILFEGAQGALLDIDFGTYPFVTSSNPSGGGVSIGSGIGPTNIKDIIGIAKAYSTRVGSGAFPTEFDDEVAHYIRETAHEYGTTTKRPRRIGWLDGVILKYSAQINGLTGLSLMLLDVLAGLKTLKVCTAYMLDGQKITTVPARISDFERCVPLYEELPGFSEDISGIRNYDDLPVNAKKYIEFIEKLIGIEVVIVSVGPDAEQTIIRRPIM